MTLENEVKNIKGRIREALYEGKLISIFDNFHSFYRFRTGAECSSMTYYFSSYINNTQLFVYCRPNIPPSASEQIMSELRRCSWGMNGGNLL